MIIGTLAVSVGASMHSLKKFEQFLETVDLTGYRERYQAQFVEMNLPKNIQVLELLYRTYWDKPRFVDFEDFYAMYMKEKGRDIRRFRRESRMLAGMCTTCFKIGIKARIYRTWTGIVTQIHAGYVAESVFGPGAVNMSEDLDRQGIDIQVYYKGTALNYDVKKKANAGVMGRPHTPTGDDSGARVEIRYEVPVFETILHPK